MEIGGLMAFAFKIFLGNPDILLTLSIWTFLVSLVASVINLSSDAAASKDS